MLKYCLLFHSLIPLHQCYYSHIILNNHILTSCQKAHDSTSVTGTIRLNMYVLNDCTVASERLLCSLEESSRGSHQKMMKERRMLSLQQQKTAE